MRRRHLAEGEKALELARWRQTQDQLSSASGPGIPDADIVPWCEKINALPGICTLQSCAGHANGERGPEGHLWIRLDETRTRRLYARVFELAERDGIERVSTIYQPWGHEIVEVQFRGNPTGQLEASMVAILGFLESL